MECSDVDTPSLPLPGSVPRFTRRRSSSPADERPFALVGKWAGGARRSCGSAPGPRLPSVQARGPSPVLASGSAGAGSASSRFPLGREIERIGDPPPRPIAAPAWRLQFYDHVLRCDQEGQWWFEALWTDERAEALEARREELARRLAAGVAARRRSAPTPGARRRAPRATRRRSRRARRADLRRRPVPGQPDRCASTRACARARRPTSSRTAVEQLRPDRAAFFADRRRRRGEPLPGAVPRAQGPQRSGARRSRARRRAASERRRSSAARRTAPRT